MKKILLMLAMAVTMVVVGNVAAQTHATFIGGTEQWLVIDSIDMASDGTVTLAWNPSQIEVEETWRYVLYWTDSLTTRLAGWNSYTQWIPGEPFPLGYVIFDLSGGPDIHTALIGCMEINPNRTFFQIKAVAYTRGR